MEHHAPNDSTESLGALLYWMDHVMANSRANKLRKDQEITRPRFTLPPVSFTVERVGEMSDAKEAGETERRFDVKFTPEVAEAFIKEIERQRKEKSAGMILVSLWGRSVQQ